MLLVAISLLWLFLHFLLYLATFRQSAMADSEKTIFHFHIFSFLALLLTSMTYVVLAFESENVAGLFAALALHAIYSMTFLEAWSVTQGSFVFWTLSQIDAARGRPLDLNALGQVGMMKRTKRLGDLESLGLVYREQDGTRTLTRLGRLVHAVVESLAVTTNIRRSG